MAFTSDYWHSLDRQSADNLDISAKDIGVSYLGMADVLDNLQAGIRAGAHAVELGFTGTAKGSLGGNQTTPEMFGKDKREAMRQLSKINEVVVSTHASLGFSGLSGLDARSNAFTPEAAERSIHEMERTIDFAADVAGGGPVVFHSDEFPREVSEKYKEFEMYPGEREKAPVYLVNSRTGRIEAGLTKDTKIPILQTYKEGEHKGEPIYENEQYKFKMVDFGQFQKEEGIKDSQTAAKEFYKQKILAEQLTRLSSEERRWSHSYNEDKEKLGYLKEIRGRITDVLKENPPLAKFQAIQAVKEIQGGAPPPNSEQYMKFLDDPISYLNKAVKSRELHLKQLEDSAVSYGQQRAMAEQQIGEIVPLEEYGKKESAKNLARVGIYAYDVEDEMKLKKPLFVAPENLLPESGQYGSHPRELRELIVNSRKEMTDRLVKERGMAESEARRVSEDHIKATFDVGHANTWKKYFKRDEGESRNDYDKRFNKWVTKEAEKLAKEGIIGHVHISDNFGYYDEHLTPGMGSAPIKDFIKKIKDADIGPMIAEPGAQAQDQLYTAMTGAWGSLASSPVYRSFKWSDIEDSYFGRTRSPQYIVGKYAPSDEYRGVEKTGPFWSGIGLE
ncbi:MAG: TIM barrel protein [archaeon]